MNQLDKMLIRNAGVSTVLGLFFYIMLNFSIAPNIMQCTPSADEYAKFNNTMFKDMTLDHYMKICNDTRNTIRYMSTMLFIGPIGLSLFAKFWLTRLDRHIKQLTTIQNNKCIRCSSTLNLDTASIIENKVWCERCSP